MIGSRRAKSVVKLAAVLLAISNGPAAAEACLEPTDRWPHPYGPVIAVVVSGDLAFQGVDTTLVVTDVSDPTSPAEVGSMALPYRATNIAVRDNLVLVATGRGGLRIIDVSIPSAPVEVGSFLEDLRSIDGVAVANDYAYTVSSQDSYGFRVLDISEPSAPRVVGRLDSYPTFGRDLEVSDDYAFIAGGPVLHVVDIRSPDSPVRETGIRVTRSVSRIVLHEGHAFLADGGHLGQGSITMVDIRNPLAPLEVGHVSTPSGAREIDVSGSSVYVATDREMRVYSTGAFGGFGAPAAMIATGGDAADVAFADGVAFVAAGTAGLRAIDVSEPMAPVEIGRAPAVGTVVAVTSSDARAYAVDCLSGNYVPSPEPPCVLRVVDVTLGAEPKELGSLDLPEVAAEIAATGDHVVVLSDDSLRVIDVSDPLEPTEISEMVWSGETAHGLAVAEGYAYLVMSGYFNGLLIVDLGDPTQPTQIGSFSGNFLILDVAVVGGTAYLVDQTDPQSPLLRVVDVNDPALPTEIGTTELPGPAGRVVVSEGFAYVMERLAELHGITREPELWAYDLVEPASPSLVGTYVGTGSAYEDFVDVDVVGGFAFLTTSRGDPAWLKTIIGTRTGIRMVDVSDPAMPVDVDFLESVGDATRGVAISGRVILADGWAGLEVIDTSNCTGNASPSSPVRTSGGRVTP